MNTAAAASSNCSRNCNSTSDRNSCSSASATANEELPFEQTRPASCFVTGEREEKDGRVRHLTGGPKGRIERAGELEGRGEKRKAKILPPPQDWLGLSDWVPRDISLCKTWPIAYIGVCGLAICAYFPSR